MAKLIEYRMPFGKYKGWLLIDLPEPYVVWFRNQGFPPGRLGQLFGLLYEIKVNGLEGLVRPLCDPAAPPLRRRRAVRRFQIIEHRS
jgi:uncharacterized protein (DUF3820 family)